MLFGIVGGAALFASRARAAPQYEDEKRAARVFKDAQKSVVSVINMVHVMSLLSRGLVTQPKSLAQSGGSGIVWDASGHVVTNFHVIQNANEIKVTLPHGELCDAKLVGVDPDRDLAVIKLPEEVTENVSPMPKDMPPSVAVGQSTYAIGYPFGLDQTLTSGLVSGLDREMSGRTGRPIFGVIQHDAAINPGSSGGPLLDSQGKLIGINTAILGSSGGFMGIGFAIPVETVKRTVDELITHGRIQRPTLGIKIGPDIIPRTYGVDGAVLMGVDRGGPSFQAGVRSSPRTISGQLAALELIIGMNGKRVRGSADVFRIMDKAKPGDIAVVRLSSTNLAGETIQERNVKVCLAPAD